MGRRRKKYQSKKTWISDTFPLDKLECQYFDICNTYVPGDCHYNSFCPVRTELRGMLENFLTINNLKFQIKLILEEHGRNKRRQK